jgi:hypothetical protein
MTNFVDALAHARRRDLASVHVVAHETRAFAICARLRPRVISRRGMRPIRTHIANGGARNHDGRNTRRDR